jgi:hypothetical protein
MSERHACRLLGLGRSTHRYRRRKTERDAALRKATERAGGEAHAVRLSTANGDAGVRRDGGQPQSRVSAATRGRIGDEDSVTTADPLERRSDLPRSEESYYRAAGAGNSNAVPAPDSSSLKPRNQTRTHIRIGTANGGTSEGRCSKGSSIVIPEFSCLPESAYLQRLPCSLCANVCHN